MMVGILCFPMSWSVSREEEIESRREKKRDNEVRFETTMEIDEGTNDGTDEKKE